MSSLFKNVKMPGAGFSSYLSTGIVLLVVVGLFFIPELIDFQRSLSGAKKEIPPAAVSTIAPLTEEMKAVEELTPEKGPGIFDRITDMANNFWEDSFGEPVWKKKAERGGHSGSESAKRQNLALEAGSILGGQSISWNMLHSSESTGVFKSALRDAQKLAKALPEQYQESRYALLNFAGGISRVLGANDKTMSAEDAVAYIEHLDMAVTDALLRERVERSDFVKWAEVSLEPVLSQGRSQRYKTRALPSFDPRLSLTEVLVKQKPGPQSRFDPRGKALVRFEGYVMGRDTETIFVTINGREVRKVSLRKRPDAQGRRSFKVPPMNARAIIGLNIYDKDGARYSRFYDFYRVASRFHWDADHGGAFVLPFEEGDPRVDWIFRIGGTGIRSGWGNLDDISGDFPMKAF